MYSDYVMLVLHRKSILILHLRRWLLLGMGIDLLEIISIKTYSHLFSAKSFTKSNHSIIFMAMQFEIGLTCLHTLTQNQRLSNLTPVSFFHQHQICHHWSQNWQCWYLGMQCDFIRNPVTLLTYFAAYLHTTWLTSKLKQSVFLHIYLVGIPKRWQGNQRL